MTQLSANRYKKLTGGHTYGRSDGVYWDITNSRLVVVVNDVVFEAPLHLAGQVSGDAIVRGSSSWQSDPFDGSNASDATFANSKLAKPRLRVVREQLLASALTDGGAAIGTKTLSTAIPAGARFLFTTIDTIVGFTGNTSAVITLGDGSDVDRYNTGTPSIFTTAAAGVDMGVPSGTAFHATAIAGVVATVTSATDITPVLSSGGSCNLNFWYLESV